MKSQEKEQIKLALINLLKEKDPSEFGSSWEFAYLKELKVVETESDYRDFLETARRSVIKQVKQGNMELAWGYIDPEVLKQTKAVQASTAPSIKPKKSGSQALL